MSHKTLAEALAAAQSDMTNVTKDSQNPHFKSSFASLGAVRDVVIPALSKHGLAIVQIPGNDGGRVTVNTKLLHASGELDCGTLAASATVRGGNEAQAVGSALTYLRRYALSSIAGVAQEDDDGNASGPRGYQRTDQQPPQPTPFERANARANDLLVQQFGPSQEADHELVNSWSVEVTGVPLAEALQSLSHIRTIITELEKE